MAWTYVLKVDPDEVGAGANNADVKLVNDTSVELSSEAPLTAGTKLFTVFAENLTTNQSAWHYGIFEVAQVGPPPPNKPAIGTPDSNPSYILEYIGSNVTIGGTAWVSGDIREVWAGNAITGIGSGEKISLTTNDFEVGLFNYEDLGVEWVRFQVHENNGGHNYAFIDRKDGVIQPFGLNNYTSLDPDYPSWTFTNTITGDMFFPCTLVFDNGRTWKFYKGQNWPA